MLKNMVGPVLKSLFRISIILVVIDSSSGGVWGAEFICFNILMLSHISSLIY